VLKSIYTPVSGALSQERVMDILANNLANLNTAGFKGDRVSFEVLDAEPQKHYANPLPPANYKFDMQDLSQLVGNEVSYVGISDVSRDKAQGPAQHTGSRNDLMIEGNGYFQVNTQQGMRLSRNGALNVNSEGFLVNKDGDPVMGSKGAIRLGYGEFEVNYRGEIYQEGKLVDRLALVHPESDSMLERVGNNNFIFNGAAEQLTEVAHPQVKQGYLEGSNVNAIQNMTAMIIAHRSYEAYQKAVSNYDQIMEKSSNTIGEVRA